MGAANLTVTILTGDCMARLREIPERRHWRAPKPHWQKEWLEREYVGKGRSAAEIAADCGCVENNILYWLDKHGIPRRTVSQARALKHWGMSGPANPMYGKTGEANPRFVDGGSPERQRLYVRGEGREFLDGILARDGFRCVRCGAGSTGPRSLHVHHLKPWAGNPALRFDKANVVTLCGACHRWVHSRKNTEREYLA